MLFNIFSNCMLLLLYVLFQYLVFFPFSEGVFRAAFAINFSWFFSNLAAHAIPPALCDPVWACLVQIKIKNMCNLTESVLLSLISRSTLHFSHINEYELMNNYVQYIILHTRIRIFI